MHEPLKNSVKSYFYVIEKLPRSIEKSVGTSSYHRFSDQGSQSNIKSHANDLLYIPLNHPCAHFLEIVCFKNKNLHHWNFHRFQMELQNDLLGSSGSRANSCISVCTSFCKKKNMNLGFLAK